jgi:hypothetical protein
MEVFARSWHANTKKTAFAPAQDQPHDGRVVTVLRAAAYLRGRLV